MTSLSGSVPIDTLIGSTVTTGKGTDYANEIDGFVVGFRVDFDGHIEIEMSTGIGLVWCHEMHLAPSFHMQSPDVS